MGLKAVTFVRSVKIRMRKKAKGRVAAKPKPYPRALDAVRMSWGCSNKVPQTGKLKPQKAILKVLEPIKVSAGRCSL